MKSVSYNWNVNLLVIYNKYTNYEKPVKFSIYDGCLSNINIIYKKYKI